MASVCFKLSAESESCSFLLSGPDGGSFLLRFTALHVRVLQLNAAL